jgi:hypothetical protein
MNETLIGSVVKRRICEPAVRRMRKVDDSNVDEFVIRHFVIRRFIVRRLSGSAVVSDEERTRVKPVD